MSNFKYDIASLLELIEQRPCIWNKSSDSYKNKILRDQSWLEIIKFLDDCYENKSIEEKKRTGEIIQQKWTNIRDAFLRSLKTKNGQAAKKKYIYADNLQFLLNCQDRNSTDSNLSESSSLEVIETEDQYIMGETSPSIHETNFEGEIMPRPNRSTKRKELDAIDRQILFEIKQIKTAERLKQTQVKVDENFFTSFIPYIKDMNEEERLDLHSEVLQSIKKIKEKRRRQPSLAFITVSSPSTVTSLDSFNQDNQQPIVNAEVKNENVCEVLMNSIKNDAEI